MNKKLKLIFDKLNKKHWDGELTEIEIQRSSQLKNCYGEYFYPKSEAKDTISEYSIKIVDTLHAKKELEDTILHEMVHHSQFLKNKKKYWKKALCWHGRFWKEEMERVGFKKPIKATT